MGFSPGNSGFRSSEEDEPAKTERNGQLDRGKPGESNNLVTKKRISGKKEESSIWNPPMRWKLSSGLWNIEVFEKSSFSRGVEEWIGKWGSDLDCRKPFWGIFWSEIDRWVHNWKRLYVKGRFFYFLLFFFLFGFGGGCGTFLVCFFFKMGNIKAYLYANVVIKWQKFPIQNKEIVEGVMSKNILDKAVKVLLY